MHHRTRRSLGASLIGALVLSAIPAAAQVVTPPPPKAPTMEERHPAPVAPPQSPPAAVQPANNVPIETAPRVAAPNLAKAPPRMKKDQLPPGIKFDLLVRTDAAGAIVPLTEPTEIAALRVNPTLGSGFVERNADYLRERHSAFEKVVIGNLDLIEKIEAGEIERIDTSTKNWMASLVNFLKPLSGLSVPERLSDAMQRASIMDPTQAEVNRQIVEAFGTARLTALNLQLKEAGREDDRAWDLVKLLQRTTIEESEYAYRGLMAEAAGRLHLAKDMDLSAEAKAAAATSAGSLRDSLDQAQRIKIYHDATALWTTAQRQDFLRRVVDARSSAR